MLMELPKYTADNTEMDSDLDVEANTFALRTTLSQFADRTSLVGPPFIISSKNWIVRSIWILLFLGAIGFTIWQVWSNAATYLSWPIKTEVTLSYATLPFPMVTICNANPIRRSQMHHASPDLIEFLNSLNPETYEINETISLPYYSNYAFPEQPPGRRRRKRLVEELRGPRRKRKKRFLDAHQKEASFNKTFVPDVIDTFKEELGGKEHPRSALLDEFKYLYGKEADDDKLLMGHQIDDMLVSCAFETRECSEANFTHFFSNKYGNCFAFNAEKTAKSKRWGNENGLSLVLYLEVDEYIRGLNLGYGLRVAIGDPGKKPFPDIDGVFISAGRESDVGVRMINVSRLGSPYSKCETNDEFKKLYKSDYSRQICQSTCVPRSILSKCGCFEGSEIYLYPTETEKSNNECTTDKDFMCINEIKTQNIRGNLSCDCQSPCNETTYDSQITNREWPTDEFLYALVEAVCRDEIEDGAVDGCNRLIEDDERHKRRNFLLVNVFYRDLNFEVMTETADYPSDKFLSDLGGSIGLGLGLCILGLVELLHLLFEIILYFVYRCKNAGKMQRNKRTIKGIQIHPTREKVAPIHPNGT